jgi:PAS domain S-box-containing protein
MSHQTSRTRHTSKRAVRSVKKRSAAVFARDLTERKKTEEKIKRSEARLKSLLKASRRMEEALLSERNFSDAVIQTTGGLIIGLDQEGRIQLFNRACEKISGYTFEEVAGKPFGDLFLPPEEAETVKSLFKSIARGEAPSESENENFFIAKDGSRRFISWKNTVIKDGNGTVELILCAGIDITEHNMLEELVRLRAAELTEANRELDAFSYSVSHDLKAPLQVMRGFGDLLLKNHGDRLDGQGREFLQLLHNEVERMDKLINDMLHLSRITRQEMQRTEVDLSECARAVIRDLHSAQPGRSIETVIQHAMRCRADERLISIVLQNLLGNSWKFTKNQKHARIEFGKTFDAGRHVYFVRDNGAGFSMKNADRLFTPFQRLHSPAQFEGTGIGLAIVKRVVQRHGGTVWAEGREDKGASFYFTLG